MIKVLIVEDEFIVANDLRLILEQAGYKVMGIAASVEEADELLLKQQPDLVLLDIRLNGKASGIDLARKLKTAHIAFVYLSANSSREILEEAKTTEPYGFLIKPFREKELLVMLDIACYRHKHSLESKLRQEELLQEQLKEIAAGNADATQKLLQIARTIQPYLSFDLITLGDIAWLRTGFAEYQFIGEKELITITGLSKEALSATPTPQKIILDSFRMEAYLVFPVSSGSYTFYSRKPGIYTKEHIALLNRLQRHLVIKPETGTLIKPPAFQGHGITANIVGSHPLLFSALDFAAQVAPYNTSVLILGESGTGKEKIAHTIHQLSPRKKGPYIKVNCAAIPDTLIESELFGHEKGAFTGATEKRKGKFEQADGGTIFLDEIGDLPLAMQVKLLRVLQEREIEYLGGRSPVKIDIRIIAATNRNLEKEIAAGNFRLDLYYRLNVFPIHLPPLRERKSDLEALALFFAKKFCTAFNKPFNGISPSMMEEILTYDWPGNIRELENILEQSVVLNNGGSPLELMRKLPASETPGKAAISNLDEVKHIQRETEREYITSILRKTKGRIRGVNGAAELLKIKPTTLESRISKLNINREDFMNP